MGGTVMHGLTTPRYAAWLMADPCCRTNQAVSTCDWSLSNQMHALVRTSRVRSPALEAMPVWVPTNPTAPTAEHVPESCSTT